MATPDIVNAFVGATVSSGVVVPIFDKLIEGLKYVYHCQDQCTALREELEKVKPLLEKISDQYKADSAMKNWLDAFVDCVRKADEILKTCKSDKSKIWDRVYEVKYGGDILKVKEKISENLDLAPMALLTLQSGSTGKLRMGTRGIVQQVPLKILGMEDHFKRVKSSVMDGHGSNDSRCVGIRGMGGAGKTLLAQMVNNDEEIQQVFGKESVIWITVGRDASVSTIYEQMRNRLQVCSDGGSLQDQRTELMNEFLKRSVLLILDDVWDGIVHEYKDMVEWLNIAKGSKSVTLITTRDESVTRKCVNAGVEIILQLSEEHSWELFCTHAFGTESIPVDQDLKRLAIDVCKECKCLPLALRVIGLAMKGTCDICEWRKTLHRLQSSSTVGKNVEEELFERLRISYDQLDDPSKICFLYFAAFPEDCEIPVDHLYEIWIVEGLFGEELDKEEALDEARCVLNELLRRSLIDECHNGAGGREIQWVKMHDILRDLAIHTTKQGDESLFKMETEDLEEFPSSWLGSSLKVKRLSIWGNKIRRYPNNFIAPSLKICILHRQPWRLEYSLMESNVQECIIEEGFFRNLHGLKYFQLCKNVTMRKLPESMGGLGCLQHLDLSWCEALEQLPESIGRLRSLQHLDLSDCSKLQQLPESIEGLGSLQHLNLSQCSKLEQLPESIEGLGSLQHLNLSQCSKLEQLPESIGGLGCLQHLDLSGCVVLKQLPESIGGLGSLQHLKLSGCVVLKQLPESIGGLGSLQHLKLSWCSKLQQLPKSIGRLGCLQYLFLLGCSALKQLPESIGELGSLQQFSLSKCSKLQQLPESTRRLRSLQRLDLSDCSALKQLPESIGELGSLQQFSLSKCPKLQQLPESIRRLGCLQHLKLSGCVVLKQLPKSIGGLGCLQYLDLSKCSKLQQLPESIGRLGCLQYLFLLGCSALKQLPESIGELGSLQQFSLSKCSKLQQLPESIRRLRSLQRLDLSDCSALKQLPESIGELGSLQQFSLSKCSKLQQLPESIGGLGCLQRLDLSDCSALKQLPESIGELGSLQQFSLSKCSKLQQLPESIGGLGCLQYLKLSWCSALKQLPESIGRLGSLQHLKLSWCSTLKQLPESIGGLGSLQYLDLSGLEIFNELPEFRKIPQLQILF